MNLEEKLKDAIRQAGRIPFEAFMHAALYDPREGYYFREPPPVGRTGDFVTAPEMGPLFGELVGIWIRRMWIGFGRPSCFVIEEHGPGRGGWAEAIVSFLERTHPDCFAAMRYLLAEASPSMRRRISASCAGRFAAGHLRWAEDGPGKQDPPAFRLILANEFLDALPVHWVRREPGGLREVYVGWKEGRFQEESGPVSDLRLEEYFGGKPVDLKEGRQAFLSTRMADWLERISGGNIPAMALLVDYGSTAEVLHHPCRPSPKIACFSRHRAAWDPLSRPGRQDITADVDFTALEWWARPLGWSRLKMQSQSAFLMELLPEAAGELSLLEEDRRRNLKVLIHPEIMGEAFQVCLLGKNLPDKP